MVARRGLSTREWSLSWSQARHLMSRHIVSVGMSQAGPGFAFARLNERQSIVMACLGGSGWATVQGQAVRFSAGTVYRQVVNQWAAYWAQGGPWQLLWICYAEAEGRPACVRGDTAVLPGDATVLTQVALALQAECAGARDALAIGHLSELIDLSAKRLAGGNRQDPLGGLWELVEADLARPWTLAELARLAGVGEETLRLQCQSATGFSPIAQVGALRMRRAAILLADEQASVARVAEQIGYANPFSFSTAFKKWMNMSPAVYQGRRAGGMTVG